MVTKTGRDPDAKPPVLPAEHMDSPLMSEVLGLLVFSPPAFEDFYGECAPRVHHWLGHRCGSDRTVAEDLVQEVFLQALRRWDTLQYYKNPHAWVFLIAHQMLWRHRRSSRQDIELAELQDHRVGDVESLLDFDHALSELSGVQQRVAILVLALEYSPAEAAQLLELNESTTRSHLRRARLKIKQRLGGSPGSEEES